MAVMRVEDEDENDEDERASSCARMAWTATRAEVVKTASVPSSVGMLDGTAIVLVDVRGKKRRKEGWLEAREKLGGSRWPGRHGLSELGQQGIQPLIKRRAKNQNRADDRTERASQRESARHGIQGEQERSSRLCLLLLGSRGVR